MSIQDNIFDIEDALENNPEMLKVFEELMQYMYILERENAEKTQVLYDISVGVKALKSLF